MKWERGAIYMRTWDMRWRFQGINITALGNSHHNKLLAFGTKTRTLLSSIRICTCPCSCLYYNILGSPQFPLPSIPEYQFPSSIHPHLQMPSHTHIDAMNPQYWIRTNRCRLYSVIPIILIQLMFQCKSFFGCSIWYRWVMWRFERWDCFFGIWWWFCGTCT